MFLFNDTQHISFTDIWCITYARKRKPAAATIWAILFG